MPVPFKKDPIKYNQRALLATNIFDLLDKDDDCFIYEDIFSQIDASQLEKKYSMLGQHAYQPRLVAAIPIYAYSQGIFSSRKIEQKCKKDLSFMYIPHAICPNFRVLSDFRKENYEFFKSCFRQNVIIAKNLGMISLSHVSLDGSKFYANTSKHKAANYKRLKETEAKIVGEIEELKVKEKRLTKIKKVKKELEDREKKKGPKEGIKDSSQISYADVQAKIMKHNGSFEYCYNGQISVDSKNQIIIGQHLTQNENDKAKLAPALADIKDNTDTLPGKISLNKGYLTTGNISSLIDSKVDGYIAAGRGEKDKLADNAKKISRLNFSYGEIKDIFTCPAGHKLELKSTAKQRAYKAKDNVCAGCIYSKRCTTKRGNTAIMYADEKAIILSAMA